jgi:hypothetical protein
MAADDDTTRFEGWDQLPMPMLGSVAEGASGTATMVPDSQLMLVDGGRCSRR